MIAKLKIRQYFYANLFQEQIALGKLIYFCDYNYITIRHKCQAEQAVFMHNKQRKP